MTRTTCVRSDSEASGELTTHSSYLAVLRGVRCLAGHYDRTLAGHVIRGMSQVQPSASAPVGGAPHISRAAYSDTPSVLAQLKPTPTWRRVLAAAGKWMGKRSE